MSWNLLSYDASARQKDLMLLRRIDVLPAWHLVNGMLLRESANLAPLIHGGRRPQNHVLDVQLASQLSTKHVFAQLLLPISMQITSVFPATSPTGGMLPVNHVSAAPRVIFTIQLKMSAFALLKLPMPTPKRSALLAMLQESGINKPFNV
jgi:hypothetical protein